MGQILSLPMIIVGLGLLWWAYNRPQPLKKHRALNSNAEACEVSAAPIRVMI